MKYFSKLARGSILLTPNARIAELLRRRFNLQQTVAGISGWSSPQILPWRAWVTTQYVRHDESGCMLLSGDQEFALWEQILRERQDVGQDQVQQFAKLARDAWALAYLWEVPIEQQRFVRNSLEARSFFAWQLEFKRRCEDLKAIDCHRYLAEHKGHVYGSGAPEKHLLTAFSPVPPLLKARIGECWEVAENAVHTTKMNEQPEQPLMAFPHQEAELDAAVHWAVAQYLDHGDSSVAIALTDPRAMDGALGNALERFRYQTDDEAQRIVAREIARAKRQPLLSMSMINSALMILSGKQRLAWDEASALLRDPYIGDWSEEFSLRTQLDFHLRERVAETDISWDFLAQRLNRTPFDCVSFARRLLETKSLIEQAPNRQAIADWLGHFESILQAVGWPGDRSLCETERATLDAWSKALETLASLGAIHQPCSRQQAVHLLKGILAQREIAPTVNLRAITVLDVSEVGAYSPTHLWIAGLSQNRWPLSQPLNPLLPYGLQRDAGIPGADSTLDAERSRTLLANVFADSNPAMCSYALRVDDIDCRPLVGFEAILPVPTELRPAENMLSGSRCTFDEIVDEVGPKLAAQGLLNHALSLFADHAACPFRGFARHRLKSEVPPDPSAGLDPRQRGELIHLLMADLWRRLGSQQQLLDYSAVGLKEVIYESVTTTINAYKQRHRQVDQYWQIEIERLQKLVGDWLELEFPRASFHVVSLEEELLARIAEFQFNVRLDRIDRLDDGSLLVLDYKTGKVTRSEWDPPRIEQPQMPIYALNLADKSVAGVAYAQIRPGENSFVDEPKNILKDGILRDDWSERIGEWREDLTRTAGEIAAGYAAVDPKRGATSCRYCEQPVLCRINELRGTTGVDEDGEDEVDFD